MKKETMPVRAEQFSADQNRSKQEGHCPSTDWEENIDYDNSKLNGSLKGISLSTSFFETFKIKINKKTETHKSVLKTSQDLATMLIIFFIIIFCILDKPQVTTCHLAI